MTGFDYNELFRLLAPHANLVLGVIVVLFGDQILLRAATSRIRNIFATCATIVTCLLSMIWIEWHPPTGSHYAGMIVNDRLVQLVQHGILFLTILTALITRAKHFTDHIGEFFALLLLATTGMMFMVGTEELLVAFISLELTSLSLYILVAFNKTRRNSAEGAFKYFLVGSVAAAFTLFGISLVYGISGATNFSAIAASVGNKTDPALILALVLLTAGFGFKVAAVPFHFWAPDAYQGAPPPAGALIAAGSKLAGFFLFGKLYLLAFSTQGGSASPQSFSSGWMPVLAIVSLASMLFGNLAAINQPQLRRLLAYSAVAHAGYAILALLSGNDGMVALLYYVFTYALSLIGAFGVIDLCEKDSGEIRLSDLAGLNQRSPLMAFALLVFVLSLAGIPPLAGFFGKFYVFVRALQVGPPALGLLWLVIVAIATSAISLYYYLQILKQAYVVESTEVPPPFKVGRFVQVGVVIAAMVIIILGLLPNLLLEPLTSATQGWTEQSFAEPLASLFR